MRSPHQPRGSRASVLATFPAVQDPPAIAFECPAVPGGQTGTKSTPGLAKATQSGPTGTLAVPHLNGGLGDNRLEPKRSIVPLVPEANYYSEGIVWAARAEREQKPRRGSRDALF
ncbi:hypothetical protein AV530_004634 [Patagioenas fasciata monilis]|uniref:Uncharacterized protein n=1 Tax=Patagioenas fasciata monilis TaxID=372326 RepID=A0A1V4KHP1_PATFA|nr:hypothetical protein AV530_004634 [Patagioenas fasciata monilis]